MKTSRKIRFALEYAALRAMFAAINALPLRFAMGLSRCLAALVFAAAGSRRAVAIANVQRAGIAGEPKEARRTVRASFLHFGAMAVECVRAGAFFRRHEIRDYLRMDMDEETRFLLENPEQGVILVTAHLGNWELAATRVGMVKPLISVARDMNNPYVNNFLAESTHRAVMRTVPKRGHRRSPLVAALMGGEAVAILVDQHARKKALMVDFFGRPAATETSPARLHLATGAPIVPGFCIREGLMRYRIVLHPPIRHAATEDREKDLHEILSAINRVVEAAIRNHPDQYLWAHRRWRT